MKFKWTLLLDDACGQVDKKHYARHIPGNGASQKYLTVFPLSD